MSKPITWDDYFSMRVLLWAAGVVLAFALYVISALCQYFEDIHVNDETPQDGPHAGKTLGL
jgi:hypothetical protein